MKRVEPRTAKGFLQAVAGPLTLARELHSVRGHVGARTIGTGEDLLPPRPVPVPCQPRRPDIPASGSMSLALARPTMAASRSTTALLSQIRPLALLTALGLEADALDRQRRGDRRESGGADADADQGGDVGGRGLCRQRLSDAARRRVRPVAAVVAFRPAL